MVWPIGLGRDFKGTYDLASHRVLRLDEDRPFLPGIGPKSAQRMAYHLLQHDRAGAGQLAHALADALTQVRHCERCNTFTEAQVCDTCSSPRRDNTLRVPNSALRIRMPDGEARLEKVGAPVRIGTGDRTRTLDLYGINDNYDLMNAHVLPALIRKVHEAKENGQKSFIVWGTGSPKREFLYVDDLAMVIAESDRVRGGVGDLAIALTLACVVLVKMKRRAPQASAASIELTRPSTLLR